MSRSVRVYFVGIFGVILVFLFLGPGAPESARAGHYPWDQGHDTTRPDTGEETSPGSCSSNASGSPFEVKTGNVVYQTEDLFFRSIGVDFNITRTYHSHDKRNGPFGHGWSFNYDQRLIPVTDGIRLSVICREGNGSRERFRVDEDGSYISPPGLPYTLTKHSDSGFILEKKNGTQRLFDENGRLTAIVDRRGHRLTLHYDETEFLEKVTGASGRSLLFIKGPNGKIASIKGPDGRTYKYKYDNDGNLVQFTDPSGNTTNYSYDGSQNLNGVRLASGVAVLRADYDERGRVRSYWDGDRNWTVRYFPDEKRTTKTDSQGNKWTYHYNSRGNIIKRVDSHGRIVRMKYDSEGRLTKLVENGQTCRLEYDERGNVIRRIDGSNQATEYSYNPDSNNIVRIQEGGDTASFHYDSRGNLLRIRGFEDRVTQFKYEEDGRLTRVITPSGQSLPIDRNKITMPNGESRQVVEDPARKLRQRISLHARCVPTIQP